MSLKIILLLPILEIISFILFGDIFGFFPVIFLIIITMGLGIMLLKKNSSFEEIRKFGKDPKDWICKKVAAVLFIIPGFVTDFLGVMLFFKIFRGLIWTHIPDTTKKSFYKKGKDNSDDIIEVDYKDLDEK